MRKFLAFVNFKCILFLLFQFTYLAGNLNAQLKTKISEYVIFGGKVSPGQTTPSAPGYAVQLGASSNIQGGSIGSYNLIKSTGSVTLGTNVYSGGTIQLFANNVITGKITAANQFTLPSVLANGSTIFTAATGVKLGNINGGNIDVNGSVNIGLNNSSVYGKVTIPPNTLSPAVTYLYNGPALAGGPIRATPALPTLPEMHEIANFQNAGSVNITATSNIGPGVYGDVRLGGNTILTLTEPGTYVFKSITTTGPNSEIIYNFNNKAKGSFLIHVHKDVNLNKTSFKMINGGSASRIFTEIHGTGSTNTQDITAAFYMSNGSNGSSNTSGWLGTLWVPYAAIKIGTPNGPAMSLTGAIWSGTQVNIVSGITMTFAPFDFCTYLTADAGKDIALEFSGITKLKGSSPTAGVSFSWSAINGGVITSPPGTEEINVSAQGTYILKVTDPLSGCSATDTVEVLGKLNSIIGAELQSVWENKTTDNTFFDIKDGYIKIDIISLAGKRAAILTALLETLSFKPGLKDTIPNGLSGLTITGRFLIDSLPKLNNFGSLINYVRPYYRAILFNADDAANEGDTSRTGLVRSEGDTTMKSHLVRNGYSIYGDGIKLGVLSDSYSSLVSGTTATQPLQPTRIAPYIISPVTQDTIGTINTVAQTFNTNTVSIDIANRDLPSNVHELPAFPVSGTDEGRAMLQIAHDIAPGAELYFRTAFNTAGDFAKGIKELKDAGCVVIVDDVTYPTEPFLRDGIVARTVNEAKAAGVSYFTSAGNFGNKSYEKNFTPINFNGKMAHNFGGGDVFQKLKLAPGNYTLVFQWVDNIYSLNETTGTVNDFDVFLTPNEDGSGLIGFNRNNLIGDPIEFILLTVPPGDSVIYNVFIVNNTPNATNPRMKYVMFTGTPRFMEYNEGTSTIVGQANADGAITVGAARYNHVPGHPMLPAKFSGITKPQIESFSSIGGTTVNGVVKQKPDLVGPDGGNTTVKMGQDYPDWALDGYSNFFGTSAAAPHAAAAAALIMEGRKKYLGVTSTSPDIMKALLQSTAVDMETPGFDFISGRGLVDADSAMRTFASPRPHSIRLVVPVTNPITIPGLDPFLLTVVGENFSENSEIWYGDTKLVTSYISPTRDTIQAYIPTFSENVEIRVYTAPKTEHNDGGFSNSLYFFDANIVIKAVNANIKYGQNIPVLDTIITINGKLLQDTTLTLADIGLENLKLTTTAPAFGFVGTYKIIPSFDAADMPSDELLKKYNYQFVDAQLSVAKMPLTVTPNDQTIVYGQPLGPVTFKYDFEPGSLPSNVDDWRQVIKLYHQTILPGNALAVIKDFGKTQSDGHTLAYANLTNLNMMVTFNALINSGKFIIENNTLVPVSNLSTLNGLYQVDVASEAIYNYLNNPATAQMFTANPLYNAKGLLGVNALVAKTAKAIPNGGGGLAQMVNGMVSEVASNSNGPAVPIVNNNMIQVLNAKIVELIGNAWVPVAANATDSIQIVNKQLAKFVNGVPQYLPDGVIVQVNGGGGLAQLVNGGGGLAQLVNGGGGLAQLVNGVVNSSDLVFQNGIVNAVVNGGGGLAQLVNGTLIAFPNGGGGLAQLVNGGGGLAQLVNGGGGLAQLVNGGGGLAQLVNGGGGLAQLVNGGGGGGLAQLVNGGGGLAQLVNGGGGLAQLVNDNVLGAGNGSNNNSAVIFDNSNINHPVTGNWMGAMFGINMITGLNVGQQKLIPGIFVNPNFEITYKLGNVVITKGAITVTAKPQTKDYDGNRSSSLVPAITGLAPTDVVVTPPIQSFDNRNVGTGKVLTASGLVVNDGNNGDNYTVTYVPAVGVIRKITATVTAQTQTREYNGNTSSSITPVVTGLILPDAVATAPIQTFNTRHAGTDKVLTASGLVINDGNNGGNYNISYVTVATGVITAKPMTVTARTDTKVYSGTTGSTAAPIMAGILSPDVIGTAPVQTFDNKNVGTNKVLTPSGLVINDGNNGLNYIISYLTNTTGVISKKTLTVTAEDKSRPFAENNPALTAAYSGFVVNENLLNSGVSGAPALNTAASISSPVGTYAITITNNTLASNNYAFSFVNGVLTITNNACLITHSPFKNFGNTTNAETSLWMSLTTKVSGQLNAPGDYLLFKSGSITFNNINSTPLVNNLAVPNGKIIADAMATVPVTRFDVVSNTWITRVPVGFSSTSDIFVTGAIIYSGNGFVKSNNNTSSELKGIFYSNKYFKDQWAYAMAAYQPPFNINSVAGEGIVTSVNGAYRAGTPTSILARLVNGASGGGGNNYTGSSSSFENFTACTPSGTTLLSRTVTGTPSPVELQTKTSLGEILAYPNPANNYIALSFVPGTTGVYKLALLTVDGKKVFELNNGVSETGKKYSKRIDVSKFANGVYTIQLISNDNITNKKIIISR